jgi:LVIVD repeat-containing protein
MICYHDCVKGIALRLALITPLLVLGAKANNALAKYSPPPTVSPAAAPSSSQLTGLETVGHIGGYAYAVAVRPPYAYLGIGPDLMVVDISDPTHPHRIGAYVTLPDLVRSVVLLGDYAYVADWSGACG